MQEMMTSHTQRFTSRPTKDALMKLYALYSFITLGTALWTCTAWGQSQTPTDVQMLSSNGEHYKALVTYEKIPKRRITTDAKIAYGRSCWALGLTKEAVAAFDEALLDESVSSLERGRIFLSRSIIEFQDKNYQTTVLFAQKAIDAVETAGPLRAKMYLLAGQAHMKLANYGVAEQQLSKALDEAASTDKPDIYFHLGEARFNMNQLEEAKQSYESIPTSYDRISFVIRRLAEIALAQNNPKQASFWLTKGRTDYADSFLDSWVDYALAEAAIAQNLTDEIRKIRADANTRFAQSDYWLSLLNASAESYEWKRSAKEKDNG